MLYIKNNKVVMNSIITNIKRNSLLAATTMLLATTFTLKGVEAQSQESGIKIDLSKGPIYAFGATPWYTEDLIFSAPSNKDQSERVLPFTIDTGTTMIWATLDYCSDPACMDHTDNGNTDSNMVSYLQTGVDYDLSNISITEQVSFGPWGSMGADIAESTVAIKNTPDVNLFSRALQFIGANDYSKDQFRTLNWYGGIGLPSHGKYIHALPSLEKDKINGYGNDFFFGQLHQNMMNNKKIDFQPVFSNWYTDNTGGFLLGAVDASIYDSTTEISMTKNDHVIPGSKSMWATDIVDIKVGGIVPRDMPDMKFSFFVDSGSSRFKGDYDIVNPILKELYNPQIHEWIKGEGEYKEYNVGLRYKKTKTPNPVNEKKWDIYVGECANNKNASYITLDASDYTYKVKNPENPDIDEWHVALHSLGGFPSEPSKNVIGGLLAGTQLMEKFYTTFEYNYDETDKQYSQKEIKFYNIKDGKFNGNNCSKSNPPRKARMRSSVKPINLSKF